MHWAAEECESIGDVMAFLSTLGRDRALVAKIVFWPRGFVVFYPEE